MNKLILITGSLATGKSTYSSILSKKFEIPVFNKDNIKEILSDSFGFSNREENLKLSKATFELMVYAFKQFSIINKDLILEANFHQNEVDYLNDLALKLNYQVLYLVLKGDVDILYKRFTARALNENRHPCHLSGPTTYDAFKEYIRTGELIEYNNNKILIDSSTFDYQKDSNLLISIKNFLK